MKWLKHWKTRILLIFAVIGPGFITANVDNDAGGGVGDDAAGVVVDIGSDEPRADDGEDQQYPSFPAPQPLHDGFSSKLDRINVRRNKCLENSEEIVDFRLLI